MLKAANRCNNMTKRDAYRLGVQSGLETAEHGDFTSKELENQDNFFNACLEICENKIQFVGHPFELFKGTDNRVDGFYEAFAEGEIIGINKGMRRRKIKP